MSGMKMLRPIEMLNRVTPGFGTVVARDVMYGPDPRHLLDVYRPGNIQSDTALPVVVFFYGGAWQSGERGEYKFLGHALARLGLVVAVADYRLYPDAHYPDFIHDAAKATAFMLRSASAFGGDPRAVFVAGHSAGAYLALMVALAEDYLAREHLGRSALAGAIGLAGPYDFLPITGPVYRRIFGRSADDVQTQPITHADSAAPPTLLLTGARDQQVAPANTAALATRLREAGATVDTRVYPGIGHILILLSVLPSFGLLPPVWRDIHDFIARTMAVEQEPGPQDRRADMAGRSHPG